MVFGQVASQAFGGHEPREPEPRLGPSTREPPRLVTSLGSWGGPPTHEGNRFVEAGAVAYVECGFESARHTDASSGCGEEQAILVSLTDPGKEAAAVERGRGQQPRRRQQPPQQQPPRRSPGKERHLQLGTEPAGRSQRFATAENTVARSAYCKEILDCVALGGLAQAESCLRKMTSKGLVPPRGICRHIIRRLLRFDGEATLKQMSTSVAVEASSWMMSLDSLGIVADRPTINVLMALFARRGLLEQTVAWADYMRDHGISANASTYRALVTASLTANRGDSALRWLSVMRQNGFEPCGLEQEDSDHGSQQGSSCCSSQHSPTGGARRTGSIFKGPGGLVSEVPGARLLPPHGGACVTALACYGGSSTPFGADATANDFDLLSLTAGRAVYRVSL